MHLGQLPINQKNHHNGRQYGLALIEVLLSVSLSSVMFLLLFTAQSHSQKVLIYSQQLHYANRLLDQVVKQVWAYPNHYQWLDDKSMATLTGCLNGSYCSPIAMAQAWASHWQSKLQPLPNAELHIKCAHSCSSGGVLVVQLRWSQALAGVVGQCPTEVVCVSIKMAL